MKLPGEKQQDKSSKLPPELLEPDYKIPTLFNLSDLEKITGFERRKIANALDDAKLHYEPGKQNSKMFEPKRALAIIYASAGVLPKAAQDQTKADLEMDENLKLTTAKRKMAELSLQEKLRQVIPIEEISAGVSHEYNIVRTQFRNLPSRVAKQVAVLSDPEKVHEYVLKNVEEILAELSLDAELEKEKLEKQNLAPATGEQSSPETAAPADIKTATEPDVSPKA